MLLVAMSGSLRRCAPWKKGAGCVNQPCSTRRDRRGSRVPSTGRTPWGSRGSNTVSWLKRGGTSVIKSVISVPCTPVPQPLMHSSFEWDYLEFRESLHQSCNPCSFNPTIQGDLSSVPMLYSTVTRSPYIHVTTSPRVRRASTILHENAMQRLELRIEGLRSRVL